MQATETRTGVQAPLYVPHAVARPSVFNRFIPSNVGALARFLALRLRYPRQRFRRFFLEQGGEITLGRDSRLLFGRSVRFRRNFTGHFYGEVALGDGVFFNRGGYICVYSRLRIGANSIFGEYVSIHDENHVAATDPRPIAARGMLASPITIGSNVWVGAKATILPGVTIGDNAVIGANSVVTRDVPPNSIAVGAPARVIREL